jgi:hypothetical protein
MLCSTSVDRYVPSASNPSVGCRRASSPEAEQGLKGRHRLLPTIVPKHELIQIYLKLRFAYTVVRADQPLLHVANSAVRQRPLSNGLIKRARNILPHRSLQSENAHPVKL